MKTLFIIIVALSLLISLPLTGCQALEKGSGELKTEDFNFNDFSNVEINGPFEVSIAYAEAYRISITADDNILGEMEISKQGNTLRLSLPQSRFFGIRRTHYVDATAKAVITLPQLRSLLLSGAAKGTLSDFNSRAGMDFNTSKASTLELKDISAGDAHFNASGASKITGNITAGDSAFIISGASTVQVAGTGSNILSDVSDASQLKLEDFIIVNANVRLRGASTGTINLDGRLDVNLGGDSDLFYFGNPVMGSTKISGDSTMHKK